ncbi:MAG: hypothetical protein ACKPKO_00840, partial [Candidatus Fonsibacter sp.]
IVCSGTLTATTLYNNTQVDGLFTNMASTYYVDSAIASKASTSYVDSAIASAVLNPDALTVNVMTITGHVYGNNQLILKSSSIKLTNILNESVISFNSTGLSLSKTVNLNKNSINSITDLAASGTITSGTMTTSNVTTCSALLNIKSD